MTAADQPDPPVDKIYDANAEYYDTITRERVAVLADLVASFASRLDAAGPPVVDIGAGTGRLTIELARRLAPCEVIAVEPSRSVRAGLAARLSEDDELLARVSILPRDLDEAVDLLPVTIGGATAFGVLPHLDLPARRRLLDLLAERLAPAGRALIEVMPPWTADPVPLTAMGSVATGTASSLPSSPHLTRGTPSNTSAAVAPGPSDAEALGRTAPAEQ